MLTHEEWLEKRKGFIGGSDAAAILGLSKWKTPHQVWLEKTGQVPPQPDNDAMFMGRELEPVIASIYERDHNCELVMPSEMFVTHPKFPMIAANADRLVRGQPKGIEIKTANYFAGKDWGEPGTDQVPIYYLPQTLIYMAVYDFDAWDFAVSIAGGRPQYYPLQRDLETESHVLNVLAEWWDKHIIGNVEPDLDGSDATARYLDSKYPRNTKPLVQANPDQISLMQQLFSVRDVLKLLESQEALLTNQIKDFIGEADGIEAEIGRITWKAAKDSQKVDWEAMAKKLLEANPTAEEVIAAYTQTRPGSRRFLPTPKKD